MEAVNSLTCLEDHDSLCMISVHDLLTASVEFTEFSTLLFSFFFDNWKKFYLLQL